MIGEGGRGGNGALRTLFFDRTPENLVLSLYLKKFQNEASPLEILKKVLHPLEIPRPIFKSWGNSAWFFLDHPCKFFFLNPANFIFLITLEVPCPQPSTFCLFCFCNSPFMQLYWQFPITYFQVLRGEYSVAEIWLFIQKRNEND